MSKIGIATDKKRNRNENQEVMKVKDEGVEIV